MAGEVAFIQFYGFSIIKLPDSNYHFLQKQSLHWHNSQKNPMENLFLLNVMKGRGCVFLKRQQKLGISIPSFPFINRFFFKKTKQKQEKTTKSRHFTFP